MSVRLFFVSILLFALVTQVTRAQPSNQSTATTQGKIIDYKSCTQTSFCLNGGTFPAGLVSGTPDELFHKNIDDKRVRKLNGTLLIQVMIDSTGHACCPRIQNFTHAFNSDIEQLKIEQLISSTRWQFVQQGPSKSKVAASLIMLKANFSGKQGYNVDYYRPTLKF